MKPYLPLEIGKKIITNNLKIEPIFFRFLNANTMFR